MMQEIQEEWKKLEVPSCTGIIFWLSICLFEECIYICVFEVPVFRNDVSTFFYKVSLVSGVIPCIIYTEPTIGSAGQAVVKILANTKHKHNLKNKRQKYMNV